MYVTPGSFRQMLLGIDLSRYSDSQLASLLQRVSTVVDAYCSVPLVPSRHDFRGGSVIDEQHEWRYPGVYQASTSIGERRVYPFHWPIKAISSFRIYVTNTQYVDISAPNNLFIQNTQRYVEVVSLAITSSGLFNALIIPNVGLATPTLRLDYTYGWDAQRITGETLYPSEGNTLYRAQNQWWQVDADNTVAAYVDGVLQTTGYTVDANEGTILFATPPGAEDEPGEKTVTLDYSYRLPFEIREAVGLIARYELGEIRIAARGLQGFDSVKIAELSVTRRRPSVSADSLATLVPDAAAMLDGHKFWRAAA